MLDKAFALSENQMLLTISEHHQDYTETVELNGAEDTLKRWVAIFLFLR